MFLKSCLWRPLIGQIRLNSRLARTLQNSQVLGVQKATKRAPKPALQLLRRSKQKEDNDTESVITSLLTKYSNRHVEPSELTKYLKPITSITVGEQFDLEKVSLILEKNGLHHGVVVADEVVQWGIGGEEKIMILANGTVVGWNLTEDQMMRAYVPTIMSAVVGKYSPESEEMDYVEIQTPTDEENGASFMQGDVLVIQGKNDQQKQLEMAAFAIGLSRSTRLSILEESLEKHIQMTRANSESLSKGLRLQTKEEDILKLTGRLFLIRGKLNLYSELIETPDLYWSEPTLEKIYDSVSRRLDISLRIGIMNRKLDYVTDEQRALLSVLNEQKGTRLEWIIIILIMVEVCFETVHFVEKYWDGRERAGSGDD
ncbi:CIC11C00000002368 [Sungouiella intermedia]|uniref:CIC11C00000002368 n=1 Tax=Sungouiella intermedia TaxID=45354 RepID=A0A1L0BIL6_9ASCO|nr:CIC11C00000002368 [[Candida] intermedia]